MKNLKIIAAMTAIILLTACGGGGNKSDKYVIAGIVPDDVANGETVYLLDFAEDVAIDSTTVADRKFVFEGRVDSMKVIKLAKNDLYVDFVLEAGTISVDLSDPYSAKGTPLNDLLNKFWEESDVIVRKVRQQLVNIGDSLSETENAALQEQLVTDYFSEMDLLHKAYLREHPNDATGALVFYSWMQNQNDLSAEKFREMIGQMGDYVLNFTPVKKVAAFYKESEKTAEGQPFVDFTIENGNRDGSPASLSDYVGKGKYVLVDFWASWCTFCRMETPVIAEVYNKYRGDKFEVVSVAVWDERQNSLAAIEEDGNTWPQILDAQAIPSELYSIRGIPHIILFAPDGTILARGLQGDKLKAKVAEVMR
jgi:thiol-disulfide isomerase/thioredoxin